MSASADVPVPKQKNRRSKHQENWTMAKSEKRKQWIIVLRMKNACQSFTHTHTHTFAHILRVFYSLLFRSRANSCLNGIRRWFEALNGQKVLFIQVKRRHHWTVWMATSILWKTVQMRWRHEHPNTGEKCRKMANSSFVFQFIVKFRIEMSSRQPPFCLVRRFHCRNFLAKRMKSFQCWPGREMRKTASKVFLRNARFINTSRLLSVRQKTKDHMRAQAHTITKFAMHFQINFEMFSFGQQTSNELTSPVSTTICPSLGFLNRICGSRKYKMLNLFGPLRRKQTRPISLH